MKVQKEIAPEPPFCTGCVASDDVMLCASLMNRNEQGIRRCVDGEKIYIFTEVKTENSN